ncbi:OLC1v1007091C1 [Oldenlandia corymbosa var. corymbosa]|uniref:Mitochondrial Rho GTPase n=1 Tax=Oldenlandia corymbosa var. corymbosa TaxID=529605 RepID=A0AAV1DIX7_OLDCO|nr:OLC1v1007091C1 [Oldenlandia corymbosa var. corymbosa]
MATNGFKNPDGVRIVVAGDAKTGKSSLVLAAASDNFNPDVPPVLPPTRLPENMLPDRVPATTVIDTSSSSDDRNKLVEELNRADAIVLTYACDKPATLERLTSFWLPELRRLRVKVPIVLAACMVDKKDPTDVDPDTGPDPNVTREIECFIECSALNALNVAKVFRSALEAVLYPVAPLIDVKSKTLKRGFSGALKRVFKLCDLDCDGALSDEELNEFQVKCFNVPLQPIELTGIKMVLQENLAEGVTDKGITLEGFLFLHSLLLEKGRFETIWTVLRKFGYNNQIRLSDDMLPPPLKTYPDQSTELTTDAVEFLKGIYFKTINNRVVSSGANNYLSSVVKEVFSTAPDNPWTKAPYADAVKGTGPDNNELKVNVFLSKWALMALLEPIRCFEYLKYVGYAGAISSAIRITRRRRLDREKKQSDRNVYQCFVFEPNKEDVRSTKMLGSCPTEKTYAVHIVDQKTLVLREFSEDIVEEFLWEEDDLASCDVAIFVYDVSSEHSWERANDLLHHVVSIGRAAGYEFPCLIVAAKDDRCPYPTEVRDSRRLNRGLGIEAPIRIKARNLNDIFPRIVSAAEHPHLNIPGTEDKKSGHGLIHHFFKFASGMKFLW